MEFIEFVDRVKEIRTIEEAGICLNEQMPLNSGLERARSWCIESHEGIFRKTGEPYAVHPILVASLVAFFGGDQTLVTGALLHDVVEDTETTLEEIREAFGGEVCDVVDGVTKITDIRKEHLIPSSSEEKLYHSALTFHKMLLKSIDNVGVLIVKLCDRLHNMLTLHGLPLSKQKRVAEETLYVYAPIAHRLGISILRNYLENEAFRYAFPKQYRSLKQKLNEFKKKHQKTYDQFLSRLGFLLMENGFTMEPFGIYPSIKHLYSIYHKIRRKQIELDEVLDLFRVRLLVQQDLSCYKALGVVHLNFRPNLDRFKDHISFSKDNGYQTIHAMVKFEGTNFEIQIRTFDMHKTAQYGIAAAWKYRKAGLEPKLDWLVNTERILNQPEQFYRETKDEFTARDIVVSTPNGMPVTLPSGSIALDFAYRIHSDLGNYGETAWINGRARSLFQILKTGDMIYIEVNRDTPPQYRGRFQVQTGQARKYISSNYRKRLAYISQFQIFRVLAGFFRMKPGELAAFTEKSKIKYDVLRVIQSPELQIDLLRKILARSEENMIVENAKFDKFFNEQLLDAYVFRYGKKVKQVHNPRCCHPVRGKEIIAIGLGKGLLEVHDAFCPFVFDTLTGPSPMAFVRWKKNRGFLFDIRLTFFGEVSRALSRILGVFSKKGVVVHSMALPEHSESEIYCDLEIEAPFPEKRKIQKMIEPEAILLDLSVRKNRSMDHGS